VTAKPQGINQNQSADQKSTEISNERFQITNRLFRYKKRADEHKIMTILISSVYKI